MTNKDESVEKNTESTVEETNVKQNIDDSVEQAEESKGHLPVSYTHLRAHETCADLVCRLLLEKSVASQ
ncbi:hypothetical protein JMUB7526_28760 [Staphylococcus aureus]